jgi:SAM-dependent methyltransferase
MNHPNLPPPELLQQQAAWLAPARSRLLRRVDIARRKRVLDLACGPGAVTEELVRRCGGKVVALDCSQNALSGRPEGLSQFSSRKWDCPSCRKRQDRFAGSTPIRAKAEQLPLADESFDLVFCQFALLWLDVPATIREIRRILSPGGVLAAIEPDYGGLIEHPPEIACRDLWIAGLVRAGADPLVGRKLPSLLAAAGFEVRVDLPDQLLPPSSLRFDLLRGLPLSEEERASLERVEQADAALGPSPRVAHLPMFFVMAGVV